MAQIGPFLLHQQALILGSELVSHRLLQNRRLLAPYRTQPQPPQEIHIPLQHTSLDIVGVLSRVHWQFDCLHSLIGRLRKQPNVPYNRHST